MMELPKEIRLLLTVVFFFKQQYQIEHLINRVAFFNKRLIFMIPEITSLEFGKQFSCNIGGY